MGSTQNIFAGILVVNFALYKAIVSLIIKQIWSKIIQPAKDENQGMKKTVFFKFQLFFRFIYRMFENNIYTVELCKRSLKKLSSKGVEEIAVYGTDFTAKILCIIIKQMPLKILGIYDKVKTGGKFLQYNVLPYQSLAGFKGKIVIASLSESLERALELREIGIKDDNIIKLR